MRDKTNQATQTHIEEKNTLSANENNNELKDREEAAAVVTMEEAISIGETLARTSIHTVLTTTATATIDAHTTRKVCLDPSQGTQPSTTLTFREKHFPGFGQLLISNTFRAYFLYQCMQVLENVLKKHTDIENKQAFAFVLSSMLEAAAWTPATLAKQRITLNPKIENYWDALRHAELQHTQTALSKGLLWGVGRNGLFSLNFSLLQKKGENFLCRQDDSILYAKAKKFLVSIGSGALSSVISFPCDLMQKRVMKQPQLSTKEIASALFMQGGWKIQAKTLCTLVMPRMMLYSAAVTGALEGGDALIRHYETMANNLNGFFFKPSAPKKPTSEQKKDRYRFAHFSS
jgi:hypothetical protein